MIDRKQETARGSAVSARFKLSKSIRNLLFQVGNCFSVAIYLYPHICIFCYILVGISLCRLFVTPIIYFYISSKKMVGKRIL